MIKNYLKTAFRFLWRQKAYSFLNVLGLAVGLACSFLIMLWVQDELSIDRFHEEGDRLYAVMRNASFSDGRIFTWSAIPKPLADGRTFSRDFGADSANYLVNEQAAKAMGMDEPLGQRLAFWDQEGTIIGVAKDFNMASLYEPIEPTIIRLDPEETWMLFVRTEPGETPAALASLEAVHKQFNPDHPFSYQFLDESYEDAYKAEIVMGKLANTFAFLAIFIACLGLFGLASFTAEQRTKEIGIRKVLGASVPNLVLLLSRDFVKLVLVAFALTLPLAYYVMRAWLNNFAYHADLTASVFVAAGVAAVVIAGLTVSYQSFRAALANPVETLRTE